MNLSTLAPRPGSKHRTKRLGCGESSGHGKTSGKGHKGQKARSGGSIRLGFEGGQMPLARKIPKRGFNNKRFRRNVESVNLDVVSSAFSSGEEVSSASLLAKGLVASPSAEVKVLARGEISIPLVFKGVSVSGAAGAKIAAAGGRVE